MTDRIKKLLMSIAALAALAAGGAAYAGAQGSPTPPSTATPAATTGESETGTAADPADKNEGAESADEHAGEGNDNVTGDAAAKAKAAALAEVPGGTVGDISAEQADASKGTDKPEAGDTPDPAYQSQIAYDVEVTKADGTQVSVNLDKAFKVLGVATEKADGNDGENAKD
jgi:uncharacterized membrane protein YkoI